MKRTIKQIKSRLRNFASYDEGLSKKQLLTRKCAVVNEEFYSYRNVDEWLSPEELLDYLNDLEAKWGDTWRDIAGGLPFIACEQIIKVLTYLMDDSDVIPRPKSLEVSTPAKLLHKYVEKNGKSIDTEDIIQQKMWGHLESAILNKNPQLVEKIIQHGADVNYEEYYDYSPRNNKDLPLNLATREGSYDVVKVLLENGADPNKESLVSRNSPFNVAIGRGKADIAKLMLQYGARLDTNVFPVGPIRGGSIDTVKLLIELGANVNTSYPHNYEFRTPLAYAVADGKIAIAKLLIKVGADVNVEATSYGDSILSLAEDKYRCKRNPAFIEFLKQNGAR